MSEEKDQHEHESCGCGCGCGGSSMSGKAWVIVAIIITLLLGFAIWSQAETTPPAAAGATPEPAPAATEKKAALPRLIDLGSDKCIPCKKMAPFLEELRKEYAGQFVIEFIDAWKYPVIARQYGVQVIPTQIFYGPDKKERFRHEGFFAKADILAKWKELGFDFGATAPAKIERWVPAQADTRAKNQICYLCDGDVNPKTAVVVKTDKGEVRLCGMHHYFIMFSCLTEGKTGFEKKVAVTDWSSNNLVPIGDAVYVYSLEAKTGRPTVKAFAGKDAAEVERQASGGNVLDLAVLQSKELANTCGFCDRAVYPEDAAVVMVGDVKTWGCCSHCALGVAARTGMDIEVREKDRLTGDPVVLNTLNGSVASLEPATAVAWFGQRTKPDGTHLSAGCFHQGFFANAENLKKWLEANPLETGEMITIQQALADKMKLSPQQIQKACKIGECAPKP